MGRLDRPKSGKHACQFGVVGALSKTLNVQIGKFLLDAGTFLALLSFFVGEDLHLLARKFDTVSFLNSFLCFFRLFKLDIAESTASSVGECFQLC